MTREQFTVPRLEWEHRYLNEVHALTTQNLSWRCWRGQKVGTVLRKGTTWFASSYRPGNGVTYALGTFTTEEEARAAVEAAWVKYGQKVVREMTVQALERMP